MPCQANQSLRNFFSEEEKQEIVSAIAEAERKTSGEIRVHITRFLGKAPFRKALTVFRAHRLRKTKLRNGVLFLLGIEDRKFVVLGDAGIDAKVPEGFWNSVRDVMEVNFRAGNFLKGIIDGVNLAGEQLARFFPHDREDINELPNVLTFEVERKRK